MAIDIKNCKFKNGGKLLTMPPEVGTPEISIDDVKYTYENDLWVRRCKKCNKTSKTKEFEHFECCENKAAN